jgi:hypothetical protein
MNDKYNGNSKNYEASNYAIFFILLYKNQTFFSALIQTLSIYSNVKHTAV